MCAFLPYRVPTGKGSSGSIGPVRQARPERPLFAHLRRLSDVSNRREPVIPDHDSARSSWAYFGHCLCAWRPQDSFEQKLLVKSGRSVRAQFLPASR